MKFTVSYPYCRTVFQTVAFGTTCTNPSSIAKISVNSKGNIKKYKT